MFINNKRLFTIIFTLSSFWIALTYSSCNSNPCADIVCQNNGTCREGACTCPSGFEGTFCAYKVSDKFIGYYDGKVRKNGGIDKNLTMIVSPGFGPKELRVYDIYKDYIAKPLNATIKETVKFDLPLQEADTSTFRGNGYVDGKYIYFWYENATKNGLETYYFEGTKREKP